MIINNPVTSIDELLTRSKILENKTFAEIAAQLNLIIPDDPTKRKGFVGKVLEQILGADGGNLPAPDFSQLGVELKTLPLSSTGKVKESTFVTHIPLLTLHTQSFETSDCYLKLKQVLWITIDADVKIPFVYRRIGPAILWSPSAADFAILKQDWQWFAYMIGTGKLAEIDGSVGECLQVRPKARYAKSLCYGLDEIGNFVLTLPRGFYLRAKFTQSIVDAYL
jgi:DNA mismatch repair protein MutH